MRNLAQVASIEAVAREKGFKPGQVALAWLLAQGPDIVPIPGARRRAHLADNVAAAGLTLPSCDLMALEEAFPRNAAAGERYPEADLRYVDR